MDSVCTVRSPEGDFMAMVDDWRFGEIFWWTTDLHEAKFYETMGAAMLAAADHDVGACTITQWELVLVNEVKL